MVLWRVLALGVGAIASVWITRCMGPEALGMSAMVLAASIQLGLFVKLNQDAHYIRLYKRTQTEAEKSLLVEGAFTLRILIASILSLLCILAVFLHGSPRIWWLPICAGFLLLFFEQNPANWVLQAKENQPAQYKASAVKGIVLTIGALCLFRPGMKPGSDLLLTGVAGAVAWAFAWFCAARGAERRFLRLINFATIPFVLREVRRTGWLVVTGFVVYGYTQFQLPLLGYLSNLREAGLFRSAMALSDVGNSFLVMIPALLYPRFIEWNKQGSHYLWQRQLGILRTLLLIMIPVAALSVALSPFVFPMIYGKQFAAGSTTFTLLFIARLVVVLNGIFGWGLWSQGADRTNLAIMCVTAIISISLNFLMIPRFGSTGAAAVNVLSELLILAGCVFASRRLAFKNQKNGGDKAAA